MVDNKLEYIGKMGIVDKKLGRWGTCINKTQTCSSFSFDFTGISYIAILIYFKILHLIDSQLGFCVNEN